MKTPSYRIAVIALALFIGAAGSSGTGLAHSQDVPFTDIKYSFAKDAILSLYEAGIVSGTTSSTSAYETSHSCGDGHRFAKGVEAGNRKLSHSRI